jgi:hypothetical protein
MIERVLECVRETVGDFREHPWHYLYEEDFRAVLFAKLREKFTETIGPDPNKAGSESATATSRINCTESVFGIPD